MFTFFNCKLMSIIIVTWNIIKKNMEFKSLNLNNIKLIFLNTLLLISNIYWHFLITRLLRMFVSFFLLLNNGFCNRVMFLLYLYLLKYADACYIFSLFVDAYTFYIILVLFGVRSFSVFTERKVFPSFYVSNVTST